MGSSCAKGKNDNTDPADYIVYVKTGDRKGAGTNADVFIAFYNTRGKRSRDIELDCHWKDDFEAGTFEAFPVENLPNFGDVDKVEIWRGKGDDWYVQRVEVEETATKKKVIFPVHRWLKAEKKIKLKKFDSQLPQDDDDSDLRKKELEEIKCKYELECKVEGLLPQTKNFPMDESFSNDIKWDMLKNKATLILECKMTNLSSDKWESFDDLGNIYTDELPVPYGIKNWRQDREFGAQRLTGCNPTVLQLCTKIPENLPVTNEMLQPILDDMTIEDAIQRKKLYIVDYKFLKDLPCTDNKKICAPVALFFVNKANDLMPVAIQHFPEPAEDNPIFLPTDPEYTWMLAKMWFNNADASFHQSCTHMGFTHLIMEAVAVATHRCLSPSHPIFRLMAPHFLYLIAINTLALSTLVCKGGWVDRVMTIGRIGMFAIIRRSIQTYRLDIQGTLPRDLEVRGVADPEALPHYYYRDDAMLLWEAIKRYVTTVVEGHYDCEEKVKKDDEIQEWARILSCPSSGCGIKGIPGEGKFSTPQQLIDTVTSFIFISSVGHAAANFAQYDEYAFPPNYPKFLHGSPPKDKSPVDENYMLNILPDKQMTLDVMLITKVLSNRGTNGLGDFEVDYQYDPIGIKAVQAFREELKVIGATIEARNAKRTSPYPYLHPKEVPNAISI